MQLKKIIIFLVCLAVMSSNAWGMPYQTGKLYSPDISLGLDAGTYLNINQLLCFVYNDGNFAYNNANYQDENVPSSKTDGLYFPRGTKKTVIYAAGIWMGCKVNGSVRMAIAEYSSEFTPGPMKDNTFMSDRPDFKVYKINRGDTPDRNLDYANWPVDQGAPILRDENGDPVLDDGYVIPQLLGDQMCWTVYNDADVSNHKNSASATEPMGVEIQQTTFAYGRSGALGQVLFLKYLIINKGVDTLEDTYISLWADPDLGDAGDDLVGCDTVLSLGYCYNDEGGDEIYGSGPPAVGFDFFQGPIVESPGDSAKFLGQWRYDYKNLPMTSFNKYINGTDPESFSETYNYMQGLTPEGNPLVDPYTGDTTTFYVAGDPTTTPPTGWVDEDAADRRYMMSSGPFVMLPGDTQEVVAAVLVGQGADRLSSITALKEVDVKAQTVFDLNFDIPSPPPNPEVFARGYDGAIDLTWIADKETGYPETHFQDYRDSLGELYVFEGYNIYQGESPAGPWKKVAAYDYEAGTLERVFGDIAGPYAKKCIGKGEDRVCDSTERVWDFQTLYEEKVNIQAGGIEKVIVQSGAENGIANHLWIENSFLDGGPIINNRPYYFAITPYSVNIEQIFAEDSVYSGVNPLGLLAATLENVKVPITAVGKGSSAILIDTAEQIAGFSNGSVIVEYLYYDGQVPETYTVDFNQDTTWNLKKGSQVILSNQVNLAGDYDYDIIDGLMIRTQDPMPGLWSITETESPDGPVDPPANVFDTPNPSGRYKVNSDNAGSGPGARARFDWRGLSVPGEAWEFRFTETGSEYYDWNTDEKWPDRAPFEIWHFEPGESEPNYRGQFFILDDDGSGGWSWGDRIYVFEREYPAEPLPEYPDYTWDDDFHIGRIILNNESRSVFKSPPPGTIVKFTIAAPNSENDVFEFTTKPVGLSDGTTVENNLENVSVVPNPYYNYNPLESDQFDRIIKFINLPPKRCTIKIFNIAGDLIREMVKDDISAAEYIWDVSTQNGLPVASGIYVWYIEADGLGSTFGKLIVFTEVEQLNTY